MVKPNSGPATDTASIQQKISEPLRRALEPLMVQPATVFDEQVASLSRLLDRADELPRGTAQSTRDSLKALEEARDKANADHMAQLRESIAKAVLGAIRGIDPQIPLMLKQAVPPAPAPTPAASSSRGTTRKPRASREEIERAAAAILKALPADDFMKSSQITEKSGLDPDTFRSAMARLKREELIVSNGVRGTAGGWKKA